MYTKLKFFLDLEGFTAAGVEVEKRHRQNGIFVKIPTQFVLRYDWKADISSDLVPATSTEAEVVEEQFQSEALSQVKIETVENEKTSQEMNFGT